MTDPTTFGVRATLAALAAGSLTSLELTGALLARAATWADLNAFVALDPERALAAAAAADAARRDGTALGALHGLPLLIKDNIDVAGWPTTAGTPGLRGYRPASTAPAAHKLLAAGAFVLGKNTLHELAHGITSNNAAFGAVRNPYDRTRIPGGSSGGTAAAIAARLASAGLATDTGGSVRIPAALCGIVGFRPTTGRYPAGGIVPISHTRDSAGTLARSVPDVALLDEVLGPRAATLVPRELAGLRLGVPRALYYRELDPEVERLVSEALERLARAGATLIEADVPGLEQASATLAGVISDYEFPRDLARFLAGSGITLDEVIASLAGPDLRATFAHEVRGPAAPSLAAYREALEVGRPAMQAAFAQHFAGHALDALVFPTTSRAAHTIEADPGEARASADADTFLTYLRNARPATVAALPALSLPLGRTRLGLPVGLELDGPTGRDRELLAAGAAVEALIGSLPPPAR